MALIHLFGKCNQHCVFCSYPQEKGCRSPEGFKGWLKEIVSMPPGLVQISGGEPLLAGAYAICLLLAGVRRLGRKAELQTNALAAARMSAADLSKIASALVSCGGYFNVNFPAARPQVDFRITRSRGGFIRRLSGVRRLLASGAPVRLTHVVSSLNYRDLPDFAVFVLKELKGVSWVQFSYIKGIGRAEDGKFIPEYGSVRPFLEKALAALSAGGVRCEVDHIPPCFLGKFYRLNVDIEKMRKKLKGPYLAEKRRVPSCRGCRLAKRCPGPRKDYIAVHKTL